MAFWGKIGAITKKNKHLQSITDGRCLFFINARIKTFYIFMLGKRLRITMVCGNIAFRYLANQSTKTTPWSVYFVIFIYK